MQFGNPLLSGSNLPDLIQWIGRLRANPLFVVSSLVESRGRAAESGTLLS